MKQVPSNRGYMGDLYSKLAKRYEKASDFKGAGSVTILTVTTMPGNDVTHPVPDNTGHITEGQSLQAEIQELATKHRARPGASAVA